MPIKTGLFGALVGAALLLVAGATPSYAFVLATDTFPTLSPGKWGPSALGTGATVTYSLMGIVSVDERTSVDDLVSFNDSSTAFADFMPAGFETEVANAFNAWSAVADITFVEVTDNGVDFNAAEALGDIRLGGHTFDGEFGVLAHGFFPPVNGLSAAGDIHFDTEDTWKIGFGGAGFDIFQVLAHEIGHAIGLDHTLVAGSLMSPFYTEAFTGLRPDDIAGAQFIYGVSPFVTASAAIPLPAALPLFGSALAVIGVMGWRRKRRNSVA